MENSSEENSITQRPAKILLIEESETTRTLLKRRLAIYGHEVYPADGYTRAIELLGRFSIDVIFLNMFIGGESSYDFLKKVKGEEAHKNIPIIMISSDNDVELVVKCIEAGAEDYLVKPLNQTLLRARLANCVARKEAYDKEIAYLAKIEQGQKQIVAQEKMASVGVLVSSISQELKNPLNFVINFAGVSSEIAEELLKKTESEKDKISQDTYSFLLEQLNLFRSNVTKIFEYGRSADQIIRFMLDQSNTSSDKMYPSSINKVIMQTVSMLLSSYRSNGFTDLPKIETVLDNTLPMVTISVQSLSKAIYNMLDNALYSVMNKFDDMKDAKISVHSANLADQVSICIRDNGSGIRNEIKDKILEPFFTTKPEGSGPGLGLSTALEVIEDHKGTLKINSTYGEFAEFTILLNRQ